MSSMFTVCPKCALSLAVTEGDLRVAQGYVRCGRCSNVFNALTRLSSDDRSGTTATLPAPVPVPSQELIPEAAHEFDADTMDVSKVFVEQAPMHPWQGKAASRSPNSRQAPPPSDPDQSAEIEFDADGFSGTPAPARSRESRSPQRARPGGRTATPAAAAAPQPTALRGASALKPVPMPRPGTRGPVPASAREGRTTPRVAPRPLPTPAQAAPVALVPDTPAPEHAFPVAGRSGFREQPGAATSFWTSRAAAATGAALLSVLLLMQILNHYRNELATDARLNAPLTALYKELGVRLVPHWDLNAYDVRQLGASADSARRGQITVRASVKNAAHRAQPLPLLRVTMQDRFGNRIAALDVPPRAYLPSGRPGGYMSAGQRIDAEMAFVDPGANAYGFEIDVCLPTAAGGTACASDP